MREIIVETEKIDKYNSILLTPIDKFNVYNNIHPIEEKNVMFVALDYDKFVVEVHA